MPHPPATARADADARVDDARELSLLIVDAAARTREAFTRTAADLGLSAPMGRVLLLLVEPTAMRAIAQAIACDPSYVTGVADQLEEAGLVTRTAGSDRRVTLLAPTSDGVALRTRLARAVADSSLVLRLDPGQRTALRGLLTAMLGDS